MLTCVRLRRKTFLVPVLCTTLGIILFSTRNVGKDWLPDRTELRSSRLYIQSFTSIPYHGHNFLSDKPFQFDEKFKNPCWYEGDILFCLPYFLLIGMRKSGTTYLYGTIMKHPEVFHWGAKETYFFGNRQKNPQPGNDDINTYVRMFTNGSIRIQRMPKKFSRKKKQNVNRYIIGDGSVCTLYVNYDWRYYPGNENASEPRVVALDYIHHFLPNAKIIVIFRDPVDRLYSEYYFTYGKMYNISNITPETFHILVTDLVNVYETCFKTRRIRECVYDSGLNSGTYINIQLGIYYIYWLELLRLYDRQQILAIRMPDLGEIHTLRTVYSFLELEALSDRKLEAISTHDVKNARLKQYAEKGPMYNSTRIILTKFYQSFNEHMADLMNDRYFLFN